MSKPRREDHLDRTGMEQMSTAGLEKLLLEGFHSPERGEAGMGDLYAAAQVLAEREPYPCDGADRAWERFRENYLPFAVMAAEDGGMPSSDAAPRRRHTPLRSWSALAALAAVLCALLLSVSVAAANGCGFLNLLTRWTDEQIWLAPGQIDPAAEDDIHIPEEPKEYANIQEALEDCGFARPVVPRLPEGFELKNLVVDDLGTGELIFHAGYARNEDIFAMTVTVYLDYEDWIDGNYTNFQKDEGDPVPYEAGGIIHLLATNVGRPIAVWANGPAECAVCGDITMEELERMIDSIYER